MTKFNDRWLIMSSKVERPRTFSQFTGHKGPGVNGRDSLFPVLQWYGHKGGSRFQTTPTPSGMRSKSVKYLLHVFDRTQGSVKTVFFGLIWSKITVLEWGFTWTLHTMLYKSVTRTWTEKSIYTYRKGSLDDLYILWSGHSVFWVRQEGKKLLSWKPVRETTSEREGSNVWL